MNGSSTVLVTSRSFSSGELDLIAELRAAGLTVAFGDPEHELRGLVPILAQAVGWIAGAGPVTVAHLNAAPHLRIVARYGVGVEAVDLTAAAALGIVVTNSPGANTAAVADHALALMLGALRDLAVGDRRVRAGDWRVDRTRQLGNLVVGIIGVGRVGRAVAARLAGFGSRMLGYDPGVSPAELRRLGIEPVSLLELVRRSDIITLHRPGEELLVDAAFLRQVSPGCILINTARATLVDEAAVASALQSGTLRRYAADTLGSEVAARTSSPLLTESLADRTLFTPHSAAQTIEAVDRMGRSAVDAVLAVLRDEMPPNVVAANGSPEQAMR
ncbi:MAG TPA: NAD(P)-dependent oxidoreductase [Propionibacteriaceae bacterium]|nr:NAD(P)-dependent oxidoreductase [Propionibacteriaceae bacterium]